MHPPTRSTQLLSLLSVLVFSGVASAVCTGWEQERIYMDTSSTFSNTHFQTVDTKACALSAEEPCRFDRKAYALTAPRSLTRSGDQELTGLSAEDSDAIWRLAEDGWNREASDDGRRNATAVKFETLEGEMSTATLDQNSVILEIEPGQNKTLMYTFFYRTTRGTLSGCTNETLNNLSVTAAAPYLTQDARLGNQTIIAGTWSAASLKLTADEGSGVTSLVDRSFSAAVSTVVVASLVLAWVL
ncbi:hypothetical protein F4778DRAFT_529575 [Xylariomycetidae sp. FL2044]|nr:hypothetical protein F4778DRAFT_529575 [Xylariomycetidae sp. FL2044]